MHRSRLYVRLTMVPAETTLPDVLPPSGSRSGASPAGPGATSCAASRPPATSSPWPAPVVQTFGVVVAAASLDTWWAWLVAFVWMGRGHALLNILAHEAAHRLLFPNRFANDQVGRWILGYPTLQPFYAYRRAHFAHHRDELGPDEPDTDLYRGYPITKESWRRKLRRDLTGESAYKNIKLLVLAARKRAPEGLQILGVQAVLAGVAIAAQRPLAYVVWIGSWCTLWKLSNRLAGDRRARRDGALGRPSPHDPRDPPVVACPPVHRPVQHRLAPRPPRRHGRAVDAICPAARRAGGFRLGDA